MPFWSHNTPTPSLPHQASWDPGPRQPKQGQKVGWGPTLGSQGASVPLLGVGTAKSALRFAAWAMEPKTWPSPAFWSCLNPEWGLGLAKRPETAPHGPQKAPAWTSHTPQGAIHMFFVGGY